MTSGQLTNRYISLFHNEANRSTFRLQRAIRYLWRRPDLASSRLSPVGPLTGDLQLYFGQREGKHSPALIVIDRDLHHATISALIRHRPPDLDPPELFT
jgi:hypothetical protein